LRSAPPRFDGAPGLSLPHTYALATAIHAEKRGHEDVRLESFEQRVVKAYADLHPLEF
jgi:hypothetical protein